MNDKEIINRLKEIKIEDYIWIIYIIIIILSLYSNELEKRYFINNDLNSRDKYRNITLFIFLILIIIYAYFLYGSYNDLKKLSINDSDKKKNLTYLSFIASLLIFISGLIYIYIILNDPNIDVEVAFN